jgi:flagellar hook-length control protein FliK
MSAEGRGADTQSKADREGDSVDAVLGVSSAAPLSYAEAATADGKTAAPPVRDPQFADVLGARLSWLAERHIGSAQITVSPRSMGSIDVRLQLDGERVRAAFSSPNAEVRHAIESHLPRLRELLSTSGFTLTDAQIGGGAQQQLPSPPQHVPTGDSADPVAPITVTPTAPPRAAEGRLLDEFA